MITKLEAGHTYKDEVIGVFIFLEEDEDGFIIYSPGHGIGAHGVRRNRIDLSTLVEVCYVNGEEMIVGERYHVSDAPIRPEHPKCYWLAFRGIIDGKPVFENNGREHARAFYATYPHWKLVEPVTAYTLVKSVDGKEVSRTEVSEEKAKALC